MICNKLSKVYSRLEKESITVEYVPFLQEQKAISFCSNSNKFWIGLNPNLRISEREELCVLMEEEAHYDVGIIPNDYNSDSYCDVISREKNEVRAKRLAVRRLIPKEKLFDYFKTKNYIDIEELSDYFEVTPQFMKDALVVYGLN